MRMQDYNNQRAQVQKAAKRIARQCENRDIPPDEIAREIMASQGKTTEQRLAHIERQLDMAVPGQHGRWNAPSEDRYSPFVWEGDMKSGGLIRLDSATLAAGATAGTTVSTSPSGKFQDRIEQAECYSVALGVESALADDLFNISMSLQNRSIDAGQFQDVTIASFAFDANDRPQFFPLRPTIKIRGSSTLTAIFEVEADLNSTNPGDLVLLVKAQ